MFIVDYMLIHLNANINYWGKKYVWYVSQNTAPATAHQLLLTTDGNIVFRQGLYHNLSGSLCLHERTHKRVELARNTKQK